MSTLAYLLADDIRQEVIQALLSKGAKEITAEMIEEVVFLHDEGMSILSAARLVRADWKHELASADVYDLAQELFDIKESCSRPIRPGDSARYDAIRAELKRRVNRDNKAARKVFVYQGDLVVNTDRVIA